MGEVDQIHSEPREKSSRSLSPRWPEEFGAGAFGQVHRAEPGGILDTVFRRPGLFDTLLLPVELAMLAFGRQPDWEETSCLQVYLFDLTSKPKPETCSRKA